MRYKGWRGTTCNLCAGCRSGSHEPRHAVLKPRFITSTNNHIPRIAGLMHRLSTHFSPPLLSLPTLGVPPPPPRDPNADIAEDPQGVDSALHDPTPLTTYHSFPSASSLAEAGAEATLEPVLRELGFGYRAGFIASSLATVRDRFGAGEGEVERGLMGLRCAEGEGDKVVDEVREVLIGLKGVGRKVADCVMLMCLGQVRLFSSTRGSCRNICQNRLTNAGTCRRITLSIFHLRHTEDASGNLASPPT